MTDVEMKKHGIYHSADAYIDAIKNTKEYREYEIQKEKGKRFPELKARIDEYRLKNYELQNESMSSNLMEELERLQDQYKDLLDTPLVSDFLQAELDFCRMMQNVNIYITDALNFE